MGAYATEVCGAARAGVKTDVATKPWPWLRPPVRSRDVQRLTYTACMKTIRRLDALSDDELLRGLAELLRDSRRTEADLVAHIGEADARRLYAREASPSMFAYCTERLHLSEAEAYLRIAAARAAREHPVLLEMLADGRLHLTAIAKLAPHLTPENREELLERATHQTKREIEELVAGCRAPSRRPRADPEAAGDARHGRAFTALRGLDPSQPLRPTALRCGPRASPTRAFAEAGLARQLRPDAVAGDGAHRHQDGPAGRHPVRPVAGLARRPAGRAPRLRPATASNSPPPPSSATSSSGSTALMRSSVPDGDLAAIIEQAVTEKLERLESRRFARTKASRKAFPPGSTSLSGRGPSPTARGGSPATAEGSPAARGTSSRTRHIPAAIKRAVHERDGGRCSFVDEQGRRCTARDGLEYHHRHPFGHGGRHSVEGVSLLCQAHNLYLAEVDYGREAMARHRRSKTESRSLGLGT